MSEVASLILKVDSTSAKSATADLDKLASGASHAERASDKLMRGFKVGMAAVATGAAAGLAVVASWTREIGALSVQMDRAAKLSNAGSVEFQRYAAGAKTVGVNAEKLSDQLKDFNEKVGEFQQTGGGGMADFFENIAPKVGITAEAFRNLSGPQALQLYYNSLEKAGLNQQQMSFYLESMASDTTALIPLLKDGGKEFQRWGDAAAAAGAIIDGKTSASMKRIQTATDEASLAFQGLKIGVVEGALPAIEDLVGMMNDPSTRDGFKVIANGAVSATTAIADMVRHLGYARNALQNQPDQATDYLKKQRDAIKAQVEDFDTQDRLAWKIRGAFGFDNEAVIAPLRKELADLDKLIAEREDEARRRALAANMIVIDGSDWRKNKKPPADPDPAVRTPDEYLWHEQYANDMRASFALEDIMRRQDQADAAEKATQSVSDYIAELQFESSLIGKSAQEQEEMIALRLAGAGATDEQRKAIKQLMADIREGRDRESSLLDLRNEAKNLFSAIVTDSARAGDALDRFFDRIKARASDKLFDALMAGLSGAGNGGGWSGFTSGFTSALQKGFSSGGFTGHGATHEVAGMVHKGEVVWSQADVQRSGGVAAVEAMRLGWIGDDGKPETFIQSCAKHVIRTTKHNSTNKGVAACLH